MKNINEEKARELLNEYLDFWNTKHGSAREGLEQFLQKKFQKLEVGRWYKTPEWDGVIGPCKSLIFVESVQGDTFTGYGWNLIGWSDSFDGWATDQFTIQASDQEVKEALIAEAKRRGFKKGVTVNGLKIADTFFANVVGELYAHRIDDKYTGTKVFNSGKWAEIISKPDKATQSKALKAIDKAIKQLENLREITKNIESSLPGKE